MKKLKSGHKLGEMGELKKGISNFSHLLEEGDVVMVVGVGERGYDVRYISDEDDIVVTECGWDIF